MASPVETRYLHRGANGTAEAAGADEAIAHGRAHLDYQRRIATAGVHRDDARMVRHEPKSDAAPEHVKALIDEAYRQGYADGRV